MEAPSSLSALIKLWRVQAKECRSLARTLRAPPCPGDQWQVIEAGLNSASRYEAKAECLEDCAIDLARLLRLQGLL